MNVEAGDIITRHLELLFPEKWRRDNAAAVELLLSVPEEFPPLDVIEKQAAAIRNWPGTWDLLPRMKSRVLLLCGTEDIVFSPENSAVMAGRLPGCWLVQLEGCGHGVVFQEPDRSARIIQEFLF